MDRRAVNKDIETLTQFIRIYCDAKHNDIQRTSHGDGSTPGLCPECAELLSYAAERRERCLLDPKPSCKNCRIHCYEPSMRARIREVMRHSGMHLIKRGRLDLLLHYFL